MLTLRESAAEFRRLQREADQAVREFETWLRENRLHVAVDDHPSGLDLRFQAGRWRVATKTGESWWQLSLELRLYYADSLPGLIDQTRLAAHTIVGQAAVGVERFKAQLEQLKGGDL